MVPSSAITKSIDANEIIDCLPVGVAILDLDLRVQAMNRSLEAMTGFSREEAVGVGCLHILRNIGGRSQEQPLHSAVSGKTGLEE